MLVTACDNCDSILHTDNLQFQMFLIIGPFDETFTLLVKVGLMISKNYDTSLMFTNHIQLIMISMAF